MGTVFWLTLFTGISVALLLWLAGLVGLYMMKANHQTPIQAGQPRWMQRCRAILALLAIYVTPWISAKKRRQWELRFEEAGLRHILQPEYMVASQVLCLCMVCACMLLLQLFVGFSFQWFALLGGLISMVGWWVPRLWLRECILKRKQAIIRALPFILDMITLCVEAGLNLHAALVESVRRGPQSPLRDELSKALSDIRTGIPRADALRSMAQRINEPSIRAWVSTLIQAESLGMSLAPMLRAQSEQRQSERFLLAEKKAMEAPVKMLLPLACCIFPCTFLVLGFPILIKLMSHAW